MSARGYAMSYFYMGYDVMVLEKDAEIARELICNFFGKIRGDVEEGDNKKEI